MTPFEPKNPRAVIATMLIATVGLMALDPYSWGSTGGELGFERFSWQIVVFALQVGLFGILFVAVVRAQYRHALALVIAEFLLMVGLNTMLVLRDGAQRFIGGYTADSTAAWLLIVGVILRVLIGLMVGSRMRQPGMLA